jgi:RNA-directed DNA polymerase
MLTPIFEADLPAEQHGYRLERNALTAVREVHSLLNTGHTRVVEADLSGYLGAVS